MEKLKKWMTLLAIVGTVLVTAVFCLMPFKDAIKEYRKKTVSMDGEQTVGKGEDSAQELYENMTEMSENEANAENAVNPEKAETEEKALGEMTASGNVQNEGKTLYEVSFSVGAGETEKEITVWQNGEGICYVFLPGFAENLSIKVGEVADRGGIKLGSHILKEGDEIEDVLYEEAYAFSLLDKDGAEVFSAPLIFMHSSKLPVLFLSTQSGSMDLINSDKELEESGEIMLLDEAGGLLYEGKADNIRARGNSTFGLLKKPYQFALQEKADFFGFGSARKWALLADGYDETKLRNEIAFGLSRALGMEYTPEGKHVDVYCNGEYYGVYYLCEKVEIAEGRLEIADMEEHTKAVYGQTELENLASVEAEDGMRKWTNTEVGAEDISGGYLFERELKDRYQEEMSGFVTTQGDAYVLASPKYATEEQVNYIAAYMQEFQDALWQEDGMHPETGRHYSTYIDEDSFVNKYLMEEVLRNYDGGVTSSFFYKKSDAEGGRLYAGPVWDYDVSLGNCNLDKIVSNPMGLTYLNDHIYGTELFAKLYEKETFREKVCQTYAEKVAPYLEGLLNGGIDVLSEKTKQAVKMDDIRWQALENRYQYYETYESNIRFLKYYVEERKHFLDEVWIEGEVYHSISFIVDDILYKEIYVKDGEVAGEAPIPSRYSSLFMGWLTENHDAPYDPYKPIYEDMVFYATWQELPVEEVVLVTGKNEE